MSAPVVTVSLSDVGRRRRANQDFCAEFPGASGSTLLVCCDGMGGHQGGEVASQLAAATIGEAFDAAEGDPATRLERAFKEANRRVRERAAADTKLDGMGTTAVALYFDGAATAWIASVGDSRAYRVRRGSVEQLTKDHSVVAELLRLGRISAADAARQPHNQLARAIGAEDDVEVDTAKHDALDGDRWLLCSDGLWNLVDEREIADRLNRESPEDAARKLVESANERGGTDNVTVQVLAIGATRAAPAAAPPGSEETERDAGAEAAYARSLEQKRIANEATPEEIWAHHEAEQSAKSRRRALTAAAVAALFVTLALAAMLWFGRGEITASSEPVPAPDRPTDPSAGARDAQP
jgi:serine/threonine protein phosphatase PrpC